MRDAPQMVDVTSGPLVCISYFWSYRNHGISFCNLFSKNFVDIQLLTYGPDEGIASEEFEPSNEEHEQPLPSDSAVVPTEETQPSPQPPPSGETPQNIIDTDDLLVKHALLQMILIYNFNVFVILLPLILSVLLRV